MKHMKALMAMLDERVMSNSAVHRNPFTYVYVEVPVGDQTYIGHGFARCCWRDYFIPQRGVDIARGRAVKDVAQQVVDTEKIGRTVHKGLYSAIRQAVWERDAHSPRGRKGRAG